MTFNTYIFTTCKHTASYCTTPSTGFTVECNVPYWPENGPFTSECTVIFQSLNHSDVFVVLNLLWRHRVSQGFSACSLKGSQTVFAFYSSRSSQKELLRGLQLAVSMAENNTRLFAIGALLPPVVTWSWQLSLSPNYSLCQMFLCDWDICKKDPSLGKFTIYALFNAVFKCSRLNYLLMHCSVPPPPQKVTKVGAMDVINLECWHTYWINQIHIILMLFSIIRANIIIIFDSIYI